MILYFYVDDTLIFDSNLNFIENLKGYLSNNFEIKDLWETHIILGMKVSRIKKKIIEPIWSY